MMEVVKAWAVVDKDNGQLESEALYKGILRSYAVYNVFKTKKDAMSYRAKEMSSSGGVVPCKVVFEK